ncbi:MAG: CDP-alcohol phosphatidyltransferase family protein [Microbacteriaceae bacterium]
MTRAGLDRIWTIPNVISFCRLALVPVFFWLLVTRQDGAALAVLIAATASDFVDGFIARRFNQVTRLGTLLDPASDRFFIAASVIGLTVREMIPLPLLVAVLARDAVLLAIVVVRGIRVRDFPRVNLLGKTATFVLFVAFPVVVLSHVIPSAAIALAVLGWVLGASGAVLYWLAGFIYIAQLVRIPGRQSRVRNRLG